MIDVRGTGAVPKGRPVPKELAAPAESVRVPAASREQLKDLGERYSAMKKQSQKHGLPEPPQLREIGPGWKVTDLAQAEATLDQYQEHLDTSLRTGEVEPYATKEQIDLLKQLYRDIMTQGWRINHQLPKDFPQIGEGMTIREHDKAQQDLDDFRSRLDAHARRAPVAAPRAVETRSLAVPDPLEELSPILPPRAPASAPTVVGGHQEPPHEEQDFVPPKPASEPPRLSMTPFPALSQEPELDPITEDVEEHQDKRSTRASTKQRTAESLAAAEQRKAKSIARSLAKAARAEAAKEDKA